MQMYHPLLLIQNTNTCEISNTFKESSIKNCAHVPSASISISDPIPWWTLSSFSASSLFSLPKIPWSSSTLVWWVLATLLYWLYEVFGSHGIVMLYWAKTRACLRCFWRFIKVIGVLNPRTLKQHQIKFKERI